MWTCKQVSKALAEQDYEKLPPWRKLALKFHVKCCVVCGKYNRQVMVMQDSVRTFREKEEEIEAALPGLDEERKARLKEQLSKS